MVRGVATLSGGEGSWRSAKLWRLHNPDADFTMVFTDVLYEDAGTYRFLLQGACDLVKRDHSWVPQVDAFPDYRVSDDTPIEEYAGNPAWRAFLADLRAQAQEKVPELIWIVEGRDPWEVFRDERFLGNSRVDPCSKFLKRVMLQKWRDEHGDRANDVLIYGIGEHEKHRFEDVDQKTGKLLGIKPRMTAEGWSTTAPLVELPPHPIKDMRVELYGLDRQRLYEQGYMHGNCGGLCVKAGHAHWQNRYEEQPERFAYDALMEDKIRSFLGADVAILTDRRGGKKRPMTLLAFAQRLVTEKVRYEYRQGEGGCGCALPV